MKPLSKYSVKLVFFDGATLSIDINHLEEHEDSIKDWVLRHGEPSKLDIIRCRDDQPYSGTVSIIYAQR